jgi:hypothetical protein
LLPPAPIPRNQKQVEAEEKAKAKSKDKVKEQGKGKDNENEEEEDSEEAEVTNLLPTTANTANISQPLSGSTTAEKEADEVDAAAPMPSVMRATASTPATTALTLATPAPAWWATRSLRTLTTEGLWETRPGKWDPHPHFPGRWQHYQQQQQQLYCQRVEDYHGHLVLRRGTSRRRPTPSTSNRGRKSQNRPFI